MIQKKKFSDAIAANISVVGELIKTNKLYPYMYRGDAIGDIDTFVESGYYKVSIEQTTNMPSDVYGYGVLEVTVANNFVLQRYTPHQISPVYKYALCDRIKFNDRWGEWRKFIHD